jgi:hypothetical protein
VVEFVAASAVIDFLQRPVANNQYHAYEFSIRDAKTAESIQLPDFEDSTHRSFLDNLSAFAIAMKYYRDVICGDRNKVDSDTAYYKSDRFNLSSKLHRGVYSQLDDFLNASYSEAQDWGFFPWLRELNTHAHKLYPYVMDKTKEMKDVLSYKTIKAPGLRANPIKDDTLSSELNDKSKGLKDNSDKEFFKILREVAKAKYQQVK